MSGQRDDAPARIDAQVLGTVTLRGPAADVVVRGRQPRAVAARLVLEPHGTTHDELAELLWGHHPSAHWRGAVRGVLSKVRGALVECGLPPDVLRADGAVVRLDGIAVDTDLAAAERMATDHAATPAALDAAIADLARPFLPDDDSDWGRGIRHRIATTTRRLHVRAATLLADAGRPDDAIAHLRRALDDDPLDEAVHHELVAVLVRAGRLAAASDAYERLARLLADEFGIAPSEETTALLDAATGRHQAARATPASARPRAVANTPVSDVVHPHTADPFVGRTDELSRLAAIRRAAEAGRPQLVVVEGPAGAGKTRLADRFCTSQPHDTAHVLLGRNRDHGERAYGALADVVDRLVEADPDLRARLGGDLAGLAPLVAGVAPTGAAPHDPSARQHLVRDLRRLLGELATETTILVLDDLQWSSADELEVLEVVLDGLHGALVVVVTTRHAPPDVAAALARLQRVVDTTTLRLGGLGVGDLTELFADAGVARTVTRRTGGLAFYASELARLGRLRGTAVSLDDVPPEIADWVQRRVRGLDPRVQHLVELASVIGDVVDPEVVARCSSLDATAVATALDELVASGLLTPASAESGETAGSASPVLQFSHELTREAIYASIGPTTAAHLHRHVAATLVALGGSAAGDAELAHHFARAGQDMRPHAFVHALRAGQRALAVGAWELAARHFQASASLATGGEERAESLLGLGRARVGEGRLAEAADALTAAADLADEHGLAVVSATAVLALVGRAGRGALHDEVDAEHVRLLRRALRSVARAEPRPGTDDEFLLPEITSDLERELAYGLLLTGSPDERAQLLSDSLARVRALRPPRPRALANALLGMRYAQLDPGLLERRLEHIDEVRALGVEAVGTDVVLAASLYEHEDQLRRIDLRAADDALRRAERLLSSFAHPYWGWAATTWRGLSHVVRGELDEAETTAAAASQLRPGVGAAQACLAVNLVNIRLYQGRSDEIVPLLADAVDRHPEIPTYAAVLALCAAECGDLDRADASLRRFAANEFDDLPADTNRFLGLAVLAHVAAGVGARDLAPRLASLLEPYRSQWVVLNCYGGGGAVWGPTAHALARLEALMGDDVSAHRSFEAATAAAAGAPLVAARIAADRVRPQRFGV